MEKWGCPFRCRGPRPGCCGTGAAEFLNNSRIIPEFLNNSRIPPHSLAAPLFRAFRGSSDKKRLREAGAELREEKNAQIGQILASCREVSFRLYLRFGFGAELGFSLFLEFHRQEKNPQKSLLALLPAALVSLHLSPKRGRAAQRRAGLGDTRCDPPVLQPGERGAGGGTQVLGSPDTEGLSPATDNPCH